MLCLSGFELYSRWVPLLFPLRNFQQSPFVRYPKSFITEIILLLGSLLFAVGCDPWLLLLNDLSTAGQLTNRLLRFWADGGFVYYKRVSSPSFLVSSQSLIVITTSWFAIALGKIRTRRILRKKADCKQSTSLLFDLNYKFINEASLLTLAKSIYYIFFKSNFKICLCFKLWIIYISLWSVLVLIISDKNIEKLELTKNLT